MADQRGGRPSATRMSFIIGAELAGSALGLLFGALLVAHLPTISIFYMYVFTSTTMLVYAYVRVQEVERPDALPLDLDAFLLRSARVLVRKRESTRRVRLAFAFAALVSYGLVLSGERTVLQPFAEFPPIDWSLADVRLSFSFL